MGKTMTNGMLRHSELVLRAERWLRNSRGCSAVFTEFHTAGQEIPDAIGWTSVCSILIECKATRSDFLADRRKFFRKRSQYGMGAERYYMAPPGIIESDEVPEKWGLLEVRSRHVKVIRPSGGFAARHRMHEIGFLVSMLRRAELRLTSGMTLNEWLRWDRNAAYVKRENRP